MVGIGLDSLGLFNVVWMFGAFSAGKMYCNDSKVTVRAKLNLMDNEDFSKFKVGLLLNLFS